MRPFLLLPFLLDTPEFPLTLLLLHNCVPGAVFPTIESARHADCSLDLRCWYSPQDGLVGVVTFA